MKTGLLLESHGRGRPRAQVDSQQHLRRLAGEHSYEVTNFSAHDPWELDGLIAPTR